MLRAARGAAAAAQALSRRLGWAYLSCVPTLALDLLLVGGTCGLLWAGIGLLLHQQRADLLRDAVHDTYNLARSFQENTIRTVDAIDRTLLFLRSAYAADPDHFDLASWNRDAQALDDLTLQISIVDRAGKLRASNLGPVRNEVDLSDREHFRVQRESTQDKLFISKPVLGRESGKWSIQFTRKILAADGAFAGVAVVSVDPFSLSRFYESLEIGRGSVLLVGIDGVIRAAAPGRRRDARARHRRDPFARGSPPRAEGHPRDGRAGRRRADRQLTPDRSLRAGRRSWTGSERGARHLRPQPCRIPGRRWRLTLLILLAGFSVIARRQALLCTQQQLVRSQEALTDTLENMSQGIFMVDAERKFAVFNRRATELLGLPDESHHPRLELRRPAAMAASQWRV